MLRLLGLLEWYCMENLILNQDALPPSCFSHIQATMFYCLVHPLVGNTRCCHHPHQKNQVHCTLCLPRKESIKLGLHQEGNLVSLKNWLHQSVPVTVHSIDERENTRLRLSAKRMFQRQLTMLLEPSYGM